MKESTTYQMILEEGIEQGIEQGLRRSLLRFGEHRWGTPGADIVEAVDAISDRTRLELLQERVLEVDSWDELLR